MPPVLPHLSCSAGEVDLQTLLIGGGDEGRHAAQRVQASGLVGAGMRDPCPAGWRREPMQHLYRPVGTIEIVPGIGIDNESNLFGKPSGKSPAWRRRSPVILGADQDHQRPGGLPACACQFGLASGVEGDKP